VPLASAAPRGGGVVALPRVLSAAGALYVSQLAVSGGRGRGVSSGTSGDGGSGCVVEPPPGGEAVVGTGGRSWIRWFSRSPYGPTAPKYFHPTGAISGALYN
jgi:hypothetical protein